MSDSVIFLFTSAAVVFVISVHVGSQLVCGSKVLCVLIGMTDWERISSLEDLYLRNSRPPRPTQSVSFLDMQSQQKEDNWAMLSTEFLVTYTYFLPVNLYHIAGRNLSDRTCIGPCCVRLRDLPLP